jgi:signal transduction histidine kinase/CheY-like chemotaxis protein
MKSKRRLTKVILLLLSGVSLASILVLAGFWIVGEVGESGRQERQTAERFQRDWQDQLGTEVTRIVTYISEATSENQLKTLLRVKGRTEEYLAAMTGALEEDPGIASDPEKRGALASFLRHGAFQEGREHLVLIDMLTGKLLTGGKAGGAGNEDSAGDAGEGDGAGSAEAGEGAADGPDAASGGQDSPSDGSEAGAPSPSAGSPDSPSDSSAGTSDSSASSSASSDSSAGTPHSSASSSASSDSSTGTPHSSASSSASSDSSSGFSGASGSGGPSGSSESKPFQDLDPDDPEEGFRRVVESVRALGAGFYSWDFLGSEEGGEPLTYLAVFEPLGWAVGVSVFPEVFAREQETEVIAWAGSQQFPPGMAFALLNYDGQLLAGGPEGVSGNVFASDAGTGFARAAASLIRGARAVGFDLENFSLAEPGSDEGERQLAFYRAVPGKEWVAVGWVGRGMLERGLEAEREELNASVRRNVVRTGVITLAMLIVVIAISRIIERKASRSFSSFFTFFERASSTSVLLNPDDQPFLEFSLLAVSANRMIEVRERAEEMLRINEARFRTIFEVSPQAVCVLDDRGTLLEANSHFTSVTGIPLAEALGRRLSELMGPRADEAFREAAGAASGTAPEGSPAPGSASGAGPATGGAGADNGQGPRGVAAGRELEFARPDGSSATLLFLGAPLKLTAEDRILGIFIDVTGQRAAEREKTLLRERLGRAQTMETLGVMASETAHELNNILSGITGYPELLLKGGGLTEVQQGYVAEIRAAGGRAAEVVGDLLTLSQGVAVKSETIDLNVIVREVLSDPAALAAPTGPGRSAANAAFAQRTSAALQAGGISSQSVCGAPPAPGTASGDTALTAGGLQAAIPPGGDGSRAVPLASGGDGPLAVPQSSGRDGSQAVSADDGLQAVSQPSGGYGAQAVSAGDGPQAFSQSSGGAGPQAVPQSSGGAGSQAVPQSSGGDGPQAVPQSSGGDGSQAVPQSSGGDGSQAVPQSSGGDGSLAVPAADGPEAQASIADAVPPSGVPAPFLPAVALHGRPSPEAELSDRPVWVEAARMRLKKSVQALVSNAVNAAALSPEDRRKVRVSTSLEGPDGDAGSRGGQGAQDGAGSGTGQPGGTGSGPAGDTVTPGAGPGGWAVLVISDTGPGIPESDRARIFEPFYTGRRWGGRGLGLTVAANTIRGLGGSLDFETGPGGTTFTARLPAAAAPARKLRKKAGTPASLKAFMGSGEKVVVVDDVDIQRKLAGRMLQNLGYASASLASGEEAIEYLKENDADVLLLDMIMRPGINGRETYERILDFKPGQKAVIASGMAEGEEVEKARALGASHFIMKPYTIEELAKTLRQALGGERQAAPDGSKAQDDSPSPAGPSGAASREGAREARDGMGGKD